MNTSSSIKRSRSLSPEIKPAKRPKREKPLSTRNVLGTEWELKYLRSQIANHRHKLSKTEATLSQLHKERREHEEIFMKEKTQLLMQAQVDREKIRKLQGDQTKLVSSTREANAAKAAAEAKHSQLLETLGTMVITGLRDKSIWASTTPKLSDSVDDKDLLLFSSSALKNDSETESKLSETADVEGLSMISSTPFKNDSRTERTLNDIAENRGALSMISSASSHKSGFSLASSTPLKNTSDAERLLRDSGNKSSFSLTLSALPENNQTSEKLSAPAEKKIMVTLTPATPLRNNSVAARQLNDSVETDTGSLTSSTLSDKNSEEEKQLSATVVNKGMLLTAIPERRSLPVSVPMVNIEKSGNPGANTSKNDSRKVIGTYRILPSHQKYFDIVWREGFTRDFTLEYPHQLVCNKCKKRFKRECAVKNHLWVVHYAGTYQCPHCSISTFRTIDNVKCHIKKLHPHLVPSV